MSAKNSVVETDPTLVPSRKERTVSQKTSQLEKKNKKLGNKTKTVPKKTRQSGLNSFPMTWHD